MDGRVEGRPSGLEGQEMIRRGTRRSWTEADDAQLRTLLEAGTSYGLISAKMKRTIVAIRERARVLNISLRELKARKK
jgi:hypothetical protein